jgi:tryptophan synthase alpha chain
MTYYNPVLHLGLEEFARKATESGASGVIVPDLPPEEAGPWKSAANKYGLDTIFLLAPTSNGDREQAVGRVSSGFIYYVSLTGVTGARTELPPELGDALARLRPKVKLPVAVGFGISRPEQVRMLAPRADGIIIGSALVKLVERELSNGGGAESAAARLAGFIAGLKEATHLA